jgi:hypothetical protein
MWNELGQVTNGCLSRITWTMHSDYVWHTPALIASTWLVSVYEELKWLSGGTLPRDIASISCTENIGLSKLSPDSTLYRKVAERRGILLQRDILTYFCCIGKRWLFNKIQDETHTGKFVWQNCRIYSLLENHEYYVWYEKSCRFFV